MGWRLRVPQLLILLSQGLTLPSPIIALRWDSGIVYFLDWEFYTYLDWKGHTDEEFLMIKMSFWPVLFKHRLMQYSARLWEHGKTQHPQTCWFRHDEYSERDTKANWHSPTLLLLNTRTLQNMVAALKVSVQDFLSLMLTPELPGTWHPKTGWYRPKSIWEAH